MKISNREKRDWSLLIFIVPVGIFLMIIAGKYAVRILPNWSVNAEMQSSLDIETSPRSQTGLIQPILPEILNFPGWLDTFLTPGADSGGGISFPPFLVFEPTTTPSPTEPAAATETVVITLTVTTPPPATSTSTLTPPPPTSVVTTTPPTTTPPPPTDCTDPAATNFGGPLPCTYPPTTCTDPLATNFNGPLPCTYPPTTCTDPLATNFNGPLPCIYPPTAVTSTPDPSYTLVPTPVEIGTGVPDGNIGLITPGTYVVLDISGNPVIVNGPSDTNYDLVFYEFDSGGYVRLDQIIIGISNVIDGSVFYDVFNWGNNIPDTNTNVDTTTLPPDPVCDGTSTAPECDNRVIPVTDLYPTPVGGTGILIDVDNAASAPPVGTYNYLVIISPLSGAPDQAQVDSIVVTEVPP